MLYIRFVKQGHCSYEQHHNRYIISVYGEFRMHMYSFASLKANSTPTILSDTAVTDHHSDIRHTMLYMKNTFAGP